MRSIKYLFIFIYFSFSFVAYTQTRTKIRLFAQTTAFDSIKAIGGDTLIFYNQDSTHKTILSDLDSTNEVIDTILYIGDNIYFIEGEDSAILNIDSISGKDWFGIGTLDPSNNISDSIYADGIVRLASYINTRGDDTTAHLNMLYTDASGNIQSARREIIPPTVYINASTISTGNTFNYYNHYSTELTNISLTPIHIANLDVYIYTFDPAVFVNVSISAVGVLTYDVISASTNNTFIDVRFITK